MVAARSLSLPNVMHLDWQCCTLFEIIGINFALALAGKHNASSIHLVATGQACLYVGLTLGHFIGLAGTATGVADYTVLSAFALGLVIVLAVIVTVVPVAPLATKAEDAAITSSSQHRSTVAREKGEGLPRPSPSLPAYALLRQACSLAQAVQTRRFRVRTCP